MRDHPDSVMRLVAEQCPEVLEPEVRKAYEKWTRFPADARSESDLQSLCESTLMRYGIAYLHLSFKAREKKGWPDLTFCLFRTLEYYYTSWPCAVELKSKGGKLSGEQVTCLTTMKKNGWHTYVLREYEPFRDILLGKDVPEWEPGD